jgi:phosphoenolpyruvate carboxylase
MLYLLALIVLLFLVLSLYLLNKINTDKARYKAKIKVLEDFIVHISNEQTIQNNQLLLSDELKQKLKIINTTLNREVFDLNYQLFEELQAKNNDFKS